MIVEYQKEIKDSEINLVKYQLPTNVVRIMIVPSRLIEVYGFAKDDEQIEGELISDEWVSIAG